MCIHSLKISNNSRRTLLIRVNSFSNLGLKQILLHTFYIGIGFHFQCNSQCECRWRQKVYHRLENLELFYDKYLILYKYYNCLKSLMFWPHKAHSPNKTNSHKSNNSFKQEIEEHNSLFFPKYKNH